MTKMKAYANIYPSYIFVYHILFIHKRRRDVYCLSTFQGNKNIYIEANAFGHAHTLG